MSNITKYIQVCDSCGAMLESNESRKGWVFHTQPNIAKCPKCISLDIEMNVKVFDENYFLYGKKLGISGYLDYRWLPEMTIPMVCTIISHLGINTDDTILDFGCARGYVVKAFRQAGYNAFGVDISEWAIKNCDPEVKDYIGRTVWCGVPDWIIAKDVLEHISKVKSTIDVLMDSVKKGIFVVVPLGNDAHYYVPEYEKDITHIHRRSLEWWAAQFYRTGWAVTAQYRIKGIKDNYGHYPTGNGFITCRRIYN